MGFASTRVLESASGVVRINNHIGDGSLITHVDVRLRTTQHALSDDSDCAKNSSVYIYCNKATDATTAKNMSKRRV